MSSRDGLGKEESAYGFHSVRRCSERRTACKTIYFHTHFSNLSVRTSWMITLWDCVMSAFHPAGAQPDSWPLARSSWSTLRMLVWFYSSYSWIFICVQPIHCRCASHSKASLETPNLSKRMSPLIRQAHYQFTRSLMHSVFRLYPDSSRMILTLSGMIVKQSVSSTCVIDNLEWKGYSVGRVLQLTNRPQANLPVYSV